MLNIVRALAAPLPIRVGDRRLLVSPPPARMRAMLIAWLSGRADVREAHGEDPPPGWLARVSAHASLAALVGEGADLMLYATTRRDHPDLSLEDVAGLVPFLMEDPATLEAVSEVATLGMLARDLARPAADGEADEASRRDPRGYEGLEATDFGMLLEHPGLRRFPPSEVAAMSLDQVENAIRGGKWDLASAGRPMTGDQAGAYIRACREAIDEGREVPPCPW